MKVAILTMFNDLSSTYSLVNVVAEQIRMMLNNNIKPIMLVSESCPDTARHGIFLDDRIEWRKVANHVDGEQIHWRDYTQATGEVHDTFYKEANVIAEDLVKKLSDADSCIMHDIHYQGWHLVHNVAVRKAQEKLPDLQFIAFTHSAPANRPAKTNWPLSARFSAMPNTVYVYPTQSGLSALAEQYNVPEEKCRTVNNSLDLLSYTHDSLKVLAEEVDLLSSDILVVYPGRLTVGKKFEKVASMCGAIKKNCGKTVKVIFCDFPSSDITPEKYKRFIRNKGIAFGLDQDDMFFTSDVEKFEHGLPRQGVLDLFTLSNLFICPSFSESFGLTVLEAASKGNFLVLNERVPALEEVGKNLNAYFMLWDARNFGYDTHEEYQPSEEAYYKEHAEIMMNIMNQNSTIHAITTARQRYSPQWIWMNQLKPLL
ncbi:glycosyltransferase [Aquibacillus halophilus]|uniref:Glycosyltransferase n=1 Tax=Aquibacillus halophilus TaxID=930132 RepID=A0A6A8DFQ0_9BACI|nr:glycosyltransferase [Aquibacillus halophilus]MRH44070.1 glycosyltransferase [Aquibacillus halophilus]